MLLDISHPLARALHHVVEAQSLPQLFTQPARNGIGKHADDSYAHPASLDDGIRLEIGLLCACVDDICAQHGAACLANPFVIHAMSRLDVVVAYGLGIIAHIVDHLGGHIGYFGLHIVAIVAGGLSLQDVSRIEQNQTVSILLSQLLDVCAHACQRAGLRLAVDEVVGKETTVYVSGLDDSEFYGHGAEWLGK